MSWIKEIQRAIDYIEDNLTENITCEDIALNSFSSRYHFQRTFSLLCGYTVGEYVRLRRLSLAGEELAYGSKRVIDVALKYGYDSPDSFTKAFQKFHGITPSQARGKGSALKAFSRLTVKISLEGGSTMDYKIVEKHAFTVIERVEEHNTENDQNLNTIPDFWARAHADGTIEKLVEMSSNRDYIFGICYANKNKESKSFNYSIAAECDGDLPVPDGFNKSTIEAKTWAVFTCVGAMPDAIQGLWKQIVTEFFPTSIYQPTCEMDVEVYPPGDMDSPDYQSEIWIPVVKR